MLKDEIKKINFKKNKIKEKEPKLIYEIEIKKIRFSFSIKRNLLRRKKNLQTLL
jgi:hypothetical protein